MHHIVSAIARGVEAENLLQLIQKFAGRLLSDTYGAIALYVRMASYWNYSRTGFAYIPT